VANLTLKQSTIVRAAVRTGRLRRTRMPDGKPAFIANGEFEIYHHPRTVMQLAAEGWLRQDGATFDYLPTPTACRQFPVAA
jgi:hypothetical protein